MNVCKYMSIKNDILVIFSSLLLMLSINVFSQDIYVKSNQNRSYTDNVNTNVVFFKSDKQSVQISPKLEMITFNKLNTDEYFGFDLGDGGGQCDGGLFWEPTIHVFLASEKLSSSDSMLTAAAVEED